MAHRRHLQPSSRPPIADQQSEPERSLASDSLVREGTTFTQAASPPKSPTDVPVDLLTKEEGTTVESGQSEGWEQVVRRKNIRSPNSSSPRCLPSQTGTKRPRLSPTCGHCLRSSHKTSECRHLLTCKRFGGAGHLAANCRVELPSPPRNRRARHNARERDSVAVRRESLPAVDRYHPLRSSLSVSSTQETAKLRKDLSKVMVVDIISGQTNEDILLEFLPGALNTPRVEAVYEYRGNSFLASLSSKEEAVKASKVGEISLPSRMGPCVFFISPWTADIGAVGAASGKGQVLLIWNLPLHAWTWSVLVELLRPIGDLVAIPQPSKPHKAFFSVLVRCRLRVALPHEVEFSFGMRKFIILITDNRMPFTSFRKDLEKYCYPMLGPARERSHSSMEQQKEDYSRSKESKGKEILEEGSGSLSDSKRSVANSAD